MLVSIQHEIDLAYSALISESAMDLHLTPRSDVHQTLRNFKLAIGPAAPVFDYLDWLGNRVHHFSIVGFHDRVIICAKSTVDIHPQRRQLDELEDSLPMLNLDHRCQDFLLPHGPVQFDPRLEQFAEQTGLIRESSVSKALSAVMTSLSTFVTFKIATTDYCCADVPEVLTRGQGGAEDCAHVALSLLRLLGIPARYVSGHRFGLGTIELETHAWVEAFVPSAGWIGLDPTQGQLVGHSHMALAIGRSHSDVPPQRGAYRGDAAQSTKIRVGRQNIQEGGQGELFRAPEVDNQLLIELMLKDRKVSADSLKQQILH